MAHSHSPKGPLRPPLEETPPVLRGNDPRLKASPILEVDIAVAAHEPGQECLGLRERLRLFARAGLELALLRDSAPLVGPQCRAEPGHARAGLVREHLPPEGGVPVK